MGDLPKKFLIDGIDRLGKSTLIQNILQELGYHLVVHYDKPKVLQRNKYYAEGLKETDPDQSQLEMELFNLSVDNLARRIYQEDTNKNMFNLMKTDIPVIFDRTHLGEMVYAPLYRGYSGEYVYDIEKDFLEEKMYTAHSEVRMVLLISSNLEMIQDDGLSFDPTKKYEEQTLFVKAFEQSRITNKVIVDVHDGKGGYRPYEEILKDALYKSCCPVIK